jgi:hypothetical protein
MGMRIVSPSVLTFTCMRCGLQLAIQAVVDQASPRTVDCAAERTDRNPGLVHLNPIPVRKCFSMAPASCALCAPPLRDADADHTGPRPAVQYCLNAFVALKTTVIGYGSAVVQRPVRFAPSDAIEPGEPACL